MSAKISAIMRGRNGGRISFGLAAIALFALSAGAVYSEAVAPTNSLPNPYVGAPFGKMPEGRVWGSTAGIAVDKDGKSIWVAERCGAFAPPSQVRPGVQFGCDGAEVGPKRVMKYVKK